MKVGDLVKHKTFNDKSYSVGYVLSIGFESHDYSDNWGNECLIRWKYGQVLLHDMDFIEVLQSAASLEQL
jgi:hypothetical protein